MPRPESVSEKDTGNKQNRHKERRTQPNKFNHKNQNHNNTTKKRNNNNTSNIITITTISKQQ